MIVLPAGRNKAGRRASHHPDLFALKDILDLAGDRFVVLYDVVTDGAVLCGCAGANDVYAQGEVGATDRAGNLIQRDALRELDEGYRRHVDDTIVLRVIPLYCF